MKISCVLPIHNEQEFLPYSLSSLKAIEKKIHEFIFVLDNCTDKSENIIRRYFPDAKIFVKNGHDWQFYAAESFQYGFDRATGDVIWALAADLIVDPTIPMIIQKVFQQENIGTICFRYLNYDLFSLPLRIKGIYDNIYKTLLQHFRREARHTGVYAFRRRMMLEIGGLADIISEYDEFCLRAKKNNWDVVYIPYTKILHLRPGLTPRKQFLQGVARYYLPHYNLTKTFFHAFIHFKPYLIAGYLQAKEHGVKEAGTLR